MIENTKRMWWLVIAILLGGWVVLHVNGQQPANATRPLRWEYRISPIPSFKDQGREYNSLGGQGWEYVGHEPSLEQASGFAVFKRPLANQ